jgi:DNA invertase Pin-like site-specific DNA recombinase
MLKFVKDKRNKIDAVIVYSTSRFSRTGTKSFSIVDELEERGVTVYSATSDYDARTPEGKMTQGLELLMARRSNAINSQTVKDNGARALRDGRWIHTPPRGYDMKTTRKQQTITVNAEGELIRKAFAMKANENLTNEEVRVRMKAMGLDLHKQRWSSIFRNIFYAGYFAHPFLEGDVIKGPQEPLVSLDDFLKVNNIVLQSHNRGYETKTDKEYAPLLGVIRCPHCGHNLTASLSTKMRKRFGKDIGYYVCSRKGCKCNASTKKVNTAFEEWLDTASFPSREILEAQLARTLPIVNKSSQDEVASIKTNLTKKQKDIEQIEYNLATAPNPKVQEICSKMLAQAEAERDEILHVIEEKDKSILNLDDYVQYGLSLKDNMLKLW